MKTGLDFIIDGYRVGASEAGFHLYQHAIRWRDTVDALLADGVCEGVAYILGDCGLNYVFFARR